MSTLQAMGGNPLSRGCEYSELVAIKNVHRIATACDRVKVAIYFLNPLT